MQKLNHVLGLRLVNDAERAGAGVDIGASVARVVLAEVVSESEDLPVDQSLFLVLVPGSSRLLGQEFVDVCDDLLLLLLVISLLAVLDIGVAVLLLLVQLVDNRDGEIDGALLQEVNQDFRVDFLFGHFFEFFNVVDDFSERHVVLSHDFVVLLRLDPFLFFELLEHALVVLLLLLLNCIQVLNLALRVYQLAFQLIFKLAACFVLLIVAHPETALLSN